MFERFTDAARNVMTDALALAQQQHSPSIRRHHLLYALLDDAEQRPDAVPALMLADAKVDPATFKATVLASLEASEEPVEATRTTYPYSSGAKKAIEFALREALSLGHNYIGADHLLLAILRSADGPLARTLETTELRYGSAREFVRTYAPPSRGGRGRSGRREMRDALRQAMRESPSRGFTAAVEGALRHAEGKPVLTSGHLLVALAEGRGTHFARLLEGVTLPDDLAARAQQLIDSDVPDGEPETVRLDPRSGAFTVTDPELREKLKTLPADKIADALRRLADE